MCVGGGAGGESACGTLAGLEEGLWDLVESMQERIGIVSSWKQAQRGWSMGVGMDWAWVGHRLGGIGCGLGRRCGVKWAGVQG